MLKTIIYVFNISTPFDLVLVVLVTVYSYSIDIRQKKHIKCVSKCYVNKKQVGKIMLTLYMGVLLKDRYKNIFQMSHANPTNSKGNKQHNVYFFGVYF